MFGHQLFSILNLTSATIGAVISIFNLAQGSPPVINYNEVTITRGYIFDFGHQKPKQEVQV